MYWVQSCSKSLLIWMMGQTARAASLQMTQKNGKRGHYTGGLWCLQRSLDRLTKWTKRCFMKFNMEKCKILPLPGEDQPHAQYTQLEGNLKEKDLEVESKLIINQQCSVSAKKAILDCIRRSVTSRSRKVIFGVSSALMKTHMEYCTQFWASPVQARHGHTRKTQVKKYKVDQAVSLL